MNIWLTKRITKDIVDDSDVSREILLTSDEADETEAGTFIDGTLISSIKGKLPNC